MSFNGYLDPRSAGVSPAGFEELEIYCKWITDNSLKDSEANFILFTIHRAELECARHLFKVWEVVTEHDNVPPDSKLQIMRFFLNPSTDNFRRADVAGWFDFIPLAHEMGQKIHAPLISRPEFKKVGFNNEDSKLSTVASSVNADTIPIGIDYIENSNNSQLLESENESIVQPKKNRNEVKPHKIEEHELINLGKSKSIATLLGFLFGFFGVHRIYLGNWGIGLFIPAAWMFSAIIDSKGLFYIVIILIIVDIVRLITLSDHEFNEKYNSKEVHPFQFIW
jgi:hypothetical protein